MKIYIPLVILSIFIISCKPEKKEQSTIPPIVERSILEKVADAHGYQNWKNVEEIAFTFNVDRDSTHFERSWVWNPKSNHVMAISGTDTISYNRQNMDSIQQKTNGGFINDRYWLLAPFNLIWDADNFDYKLVENDTAPISKKPSKKLTIVYGNEGGYTPGDAYDFYLGDDYLIKEWVFRKANQLEPSMTTTWENYMNLDGFKFAKDHKKQNENFNLYFDGVRTVVKD